MTVFSYTCRDYVCGGFADVSMSGDDLVRVLSALGNAQRLRIMAALVPGRNYVSQLARELQMSRPFFITGFSRRSVNRSWPMAAKRKKRVQPSNSYLRQNRMR